MKELNYQRKRGKTPHNVQAFITENWLGQRWKIHPRTLMKLVEWAKDERVDRAVRSIRTYTVHQKLVRLNDKWTLRDSAKLFELPAYVFIRYYAAGRVLALDEPSYTYLVITGADKDEPFTVGEIVIVDQANLEICGRQRRPQRHPHVWWEEYKTLDAALKRALVVTAQGGD